MEERVKNISLFKRMKSETEEYWKNLMKTYFIDKPHVVVSIIVIWL
jgi:Zn-dependent M16 (insulinase) family peptidase